MQTLSVLLPTLLALSANAATLGTFQTSVGTMQIEFFDEDKPVTVSNFIAYVTSGRYQDQIIHRWEPGFVIQGGGYRVGTSTTPPQLLSVQKSEPITNEYSVGRTFSNTYGTLAMARVGGQTNSASSEWFFNLGNNSFLDNVDGGFTVFGRVLSGTNVLNLFRTQPGSAGIYTNRTILPGGTPLPLLNSTNATFNNLVYLAIVLERDLDLEITRASTGERTISWTTHPGLTNTLEFKTNLSAAAWQPLTNTLGNGSRLQITDASADTHRFYRARLPR
jgi:peptidyl-prolyl cis-trans isomerase A (cyclophilin A)